MLQQVKHRELGELTPLAQIYVNAESTERLRTFSFEEDVDEWGPHYIAAFRANGVPAFAIIQYRRDPEDMANLFIAGDIEEDEISNCIAEIATAIALPYEAFRWKSHDGEMVSLAPKKAA